MNKGAHRNLLNHIDLHVVIVAMISYFLVVGFFMAVTVVPSQPRLFATIIRVGWIPCAIVFPMIIIRTFEKRAHLGQAIRYLTTNLLITAAVGFLTGLSVYSRLPRSKQQPVISPASGGQMAR